MTVNYLLELIGVVLEHAIAKTQLYKAIVFYSSGGVMLNTEHLTLQPGEEFDVDFGDWTIS